MKRVLLTALLALGCVSTAQAERLCPLPRVLMNIGPGQSLSSTQLSVWLATYGVPPGVSDPNRYVAVTAANQRCVALYGSGVWARITGPYTLTDMVNSYSISEGVSFQCRKCSGQVGLPVEIAKP